MNVSSMTTVQDSTVKFTFSIGLLSSVERCQCCEVYVERRLLLSQTEK